MAGEFRAPDFTKKARATLNLAADISAKMKHGYVGTEHILLGMIEEGTGVAARVLFHNGVDLERLIQLIEQLIAPDMSVTVKDRDGYTPRAAEVIENSKKEASRLRSGQVGTEHLLIAIIKENDCVATRLLNTIGVNTQKMYVEVLASVGQDPASFKEELIRAKSMKKKGARSTTSVLDQYSRDLTKMAREGKTDPVIGREAEISRVIQILSRRTKNNPCLIGEPGVGKTAIVEGLARRIDEGSVPDTVKNKRVVTLDLSGMVAGSKYRGEFEERIKNVVREVIEAGNVLLFLDELHTIIGAGGAEGAIDASNILKPSLARGEIQLIGATTLDEYRKHIEKDAALERRFQPVRVEEPDEDDTLEILKGVRENYEDHHGVTITDEALSAAVKLSGRYINDRFLPDKAIDLIDEAAAKVRLAGLKLPAGMKELEEEIARLETLKEQSIRFEAFEQAADLKQQQEKKLKKYQRLQEKYVQSTSERQLAVEESDIADVVASWTKIPVKKLAEEEGARLLKLESILQKRVIGQNEAVAAVSRAIKRGRVGLKDPNRPIGSFLFLGPTGVGKTELSKALAEALFNTESALIRVDMSEYMEKHSVSKMIGSPPGYVGFDEGGQLSEKIRRNPYSVLLFDEIEKAHPDVFNILLQVLEDGHITDATGRKVSFKNCVIIMTSNAGAQRIMEPKKLGFSTEEDAQADYKKMKEGVMEEVKRIFKPEFINRIDEIIVFHVLDEENMKQIVTLLSKNLIKRSKEQMDITLSITPAVKKHIVEKGIDKKFGARPLRRAIQSMIEDALAEEILTGTIQRGDKVTAALEKGAIVFRKTEENHS